MGKPYAKELKQLESTFNAVMDLDISALSDFVSLASMLPLYVVGSGGSLSAAYLVAYFHQRWANQFAKAITPLEAVGIADPRQSCFWFFSAGGRNTDIIDAFKDIVKKEPDQLCITCARTESQLAHCAKKYEYTDIFDFDLPAKRDGFLATNSLFAFALLAFRAYAEVFILKGSKPKQFKDLLVPNVSTNSTIDNFRVEFTPIWKRDNLIVLYGPSTQPAAFDLESKFVEASLGYVLLSDYRNFAHGRHHWLAKRGNTSAVLALSTEQEKKIADKTIALLPKDIPVVHLSFSDHGIYAPLAAILAVLQIVAFAGEERTIDPGRPGVPPFGSKIYHLKGLRDTRLDKCLDTIIHRKIPPSIEQSHLYGKNLKESARRFIREIQEKPFSAIVFDYDGTLCAKKDRYDKLCGIDQKISAELIRLLRSGIYLGIATGRGKSVRDSLKQAIQDELLFKRVMLGYYNGAECRLLSDETLPDGTEKVGPSLVQINELLNEDNDLRSLKVKITRRKYQITIESVKQSQLRLIWEIVNTILNESQTLGIRVFLSRHSIDILAPTTTKTKVIDKMMQEFQINDENSILSIGDMGAWPGNDFELLKRRFSLSVDQVSLSRKYCWNLAPAGSKGVQATLYYLGCMEQNHGILRFRLHRQLIGKES